MEVESTSPDTGQHGGDVPMARHRDAHALSGTMVRAFYGYFPKMKTLTSSLRYRAPLRFGASVLVIISALPGLAHSQVEATLPDVVVSATRFDASLSSLPFGVNVITKGDIERTGVSTVNEAVIKLLGVPGRVDYFGGGDYGLDLRGFGSTASSNQVVIVDGIKVNEADLSGTRLAGISINSVERIEVLRGSGSVLYGEGATGGVIVITTKAARNAMSTNQADLYAAVGSDGLNEVRATATLAGGGFLLDVSGNKRTADNHRDNFKSVVEGDVMHAQWSNDWLRLGASHANDVLDTGLPGALSAVQYQLNPNQATSLKDKASIKNSRQTLFASAELGEWQLGLDAGQRSKDLDSLTSGYVYQYAVDANTLALRGKNEGRIGNLRNALTLGRDQADWIRTVPGAFGSISQQKTNALYLQDDVTLMGGTRLSAGYRTENIKQTDSATSISRDSEQTAWELGVKQALSNTLSLYGRIGNSFRLANIDELGFTKSGTVLQPQSSRDLELGSRWHYPNGRVELRYYRNNMNNELGYDPTVVNINSWTGLGANVNFDPTLRQGLELETQHSLSKTWGVQLNLGVRESKFVQGSHTGMTVPLVAGTTLTLRADWRPAPSHSVNAGVLWVSSQPVDFSNLCSVPGYATVDARYAYEVRNLVFSVGATNLTDAKYYTQAFTCTAGVTNGIYPEAGRALTAAVRVKF
jgi:iron complex outermembrane receptor protein